jgi:tetratricopeptide (TPR) repeat protein
MRRIYIALAVLLCSSVVFAGSMELTSARLYKKQGELLKSLQFYNAELQKNPGSVEALFERGELLGEIAADPGKETLKLEASDSAANPQRTLFERMMADFDKVRASADNKDAKKMAKKMDDQLGRYWYTFYTGAVKSDSLKQDSLALQQVDMALLFKPRDWRTFALQGQVFNRMDQQGKSLEAWDKAHRLIDETNLAKEKPEEYKQATSVIHARLLEGYYNAGQYTKAIEYADQIVADEPDNADAVQFKAFSLAQLASDTTITSKARDSLRAVAVAALTAAQKARPGYAPILYTIGQFNIQLGDTAEALRAFEEYLKIDSTDRDARFVVGVIYLEGGTYADNKKALNTFQTLTRYHPEDGAAWINLGIATIRAGDNAAGKKYIEKGKELSSK